MDAQTLDVNPSQSQTNRTNGLSSPWIVPGEPPSLAALRRERKRIIAIFGKHGAFNVRVFGSVARNEATPESDIDFVCDYDINKISAWFPSGLALELEDFLGIRVDIVVGMNFRTLRIKKKVEKDLVEL
jgi:uncharacterized protein